MTHWFPRDTDAAAKVEPGCIVAWRYQPWRLISLTYETRPGETDGRQIYVLRPVDVDHTVAAHTRDEHLIGNRDARLRVLREHYGLCVHCAELLPCRASVVAEMAAREMERMSFYETPGVCPACQEPVTHRQHSETFPNVVVPLGPPVTFHAGRWTCRSQLEQYRVKAGQPESQLRLDGGEPS